MLDDRRLDDDADLAQQREHGCVTSAERPAREADQVGEQQRELVLAGAAAGALRQRLPHLQPGEPELLDHALALGTQRGDAAGDQLERRVAGGRQRIAEPLVAGQSPAQAARGREQASAGVESHRGATQPREAIVRVIAGPWIAPSSLALVRAHGPGGYETNNGGGRIRTCEG